MHLSYSFINELNLCPHSYINRLNGLPRVEREYWNQGKLAHEVVQKHVSGVKRHPQMDHLPTFDLVETCERDPKMKIEFKHGGYDFVGYVDMRDTTRGDFGDIKSGSSWSIGMIKKHPQFQIYSYALGLSDFWLINLPKEPDKWTKDNIKITQVKFTDKDRDKGLEFINQGIHLIENIKDALAQEDLNKSRWHCHTLNCNICGANNEEIIH